MKLLNESPSLPPVVLELTNHEAKVLFALMKMNITIPNAVTSQLGHLEGHTKGQIKEFMSECEHTLRRGLGL